MSRTTFVAVVVALVVGASATAGVQAVWRPISSGSASGEFAIATVNGEASKPKALRVRLLGNSRADVTAIFSCSRDKKMRPGQALVLNVRGSEYCTVTASGAGDGRIVLRIEERVR